MSGAGESKGNGGYVWYIQREQNKIKWDTSVKIEGGNQILDHIRNGHVASSKQKTKGKVDDRKLSSSPKHSNIRDRPLKQILKENIRTVPCLRKWYIIVMFILVITIGTTSLLLSGRDGHVLVQTEEL